jgi:hypothetical protein
MRAVTQHISVALLVLFFVRPFPAAFFAFCHLKEVSIATSQRLAFALRRTRPVSLTRWSRVGQGSCYWDFGSINFFLVQA